MTPSLRRSLAAARGFATLSLAALLAAAGCASSAGQQQSASANSAMAVQPAITVDGDIAEWPADSAVAADEHYIYFRFSVENEQFTLQGAPQTLAIMIDADADATTGKRVDLGRAAALGVDLEVLFSPSKAMGGTGRGVAIWAVDETGGRTPLSSTDYDFLFSPTYASTWYEARITRTPDFAGPLPIAGMLSDGEVRGTIATLDDMGGVDAWADPFTIDLGPVCESGRRQFRADIPARPAGAVRVMSYNVLRSAPASNPQPFKRIFDAVQPDVILLQEWDEGGAAAVQSWFTANVPAERGWNIRHLQGAGVAVVSRYPIDPLFEQPVTTSEGNRPVRVAGAKIATPAGVMTAASVHLKCCGTKGSSEDLRRMDEARAINAAFGKASDQANAQLRIIGGDLNLVGSRPPLDLLRAGIDIDGSDMAVVNPGVLGDRSFYTWWEDGNEFSPGRLDYLVVSDSGAQVVNAFVLDTTRMSEESLARCGLDKSDCAASDHRPMVVDLIAR